MERIGIIILLSLFFGCTTNQTTKKDLEGPAIRGWNILSDDTAKAIIALDQAKNYRINHLQISHHLIMDLKDVRKADKLQKTRNLITEAHEQGIDKVLVWDHALYHLDYYPEQFKNAKGLLILDNPDFWKWLKADYRSMLDSLPEADGIILTFIETGARVEDQYSEKWKTPAEKLANLVDSLATVIIDEKRMQLYIRTFIYSKKELEAVLGSINLVQHPGVRVMTKEVPHDFFLTHPVSDFITEFNKDVIIEFDLGHEYHGQGIIASILPEITTNRWKYYSGQKNVIGYVARTDRYGTTQNMGRPTELNLYALKRISEDTSLNINTIIEEFIVMKYGHDAVDFLLPVFLETDDIIRSVIYTMGLHMNDHSRFEFDYPSIYTRHCSGKWLKNPVINLAHGIDKEFHYWKEIVEHLSPARFKMKSRRDGKNTILYDEAPWVIENGWVTPEDKMNEDYLKHVVTEKKYGVEKARWALQQVEKTESIISDQDDYEMLLHLYERTYLTARLYLAGARAYFGYRTYLNDPSNIKVKEIAAEGLEGLKTLSEEMKQYPDPGPTGQFSWIEDARRAMQLYNNITTGWDVYNNKKLEIH